MNEYNNYKQKYLKYKNKYINLKNQQGGTLSPSDELIAYLFDKLNDNGTEFNDTQKNFDSYVGTLFNKNNGEKYFISMDAFRSYVKNKNINEGTPKYNKLYNIIRILAPTINTESDIQRIKLYSSNILGINMYNVHADDDELFLKFVNDPLINDLLTDLSRKYLNISKNGANNSEYHIYPKLNSTTKMNDIVYAGHGVRDRFKYSYNHIRVMAYIIYSTFDLYIINSLKAAFNVSSIKFTN